MEISLDANNVIIQFGNGLGERAGCTIHEIDDGLATELAKPGTKNLNPDGSITVTPPEPDLAAHAALMEQRANDQADHALIRAAASGHAPIDQAFAAAVARQLGSLNG